MVLVSPVESLKTDAPVRRMGALSQPAYRRYWLGSLAAVGAVQLVMIGQGWMIVNQLGGSPLDLGYLGAATALPTIAVNLFGGVVADRVNRRLLLIATSILSAALLTVLVVLTVTEAVRIWHVIAIGAVLGLVSGFGLACTERLLSCAHRAGVHHERGGVEFSVVAGDEGGCASHRGPADPAVWDGRRVHGRRDGVWQQWCWSCFRSSRQCRDPPLGAV